MKKRLLKLGMYKLFITAGLCVLPFQVSFADEREFLNIKQDFYNYQNESPYAVIKRDTAFSFIVTSQKILGINEVKLDEQAILQEKLKKMEEEALEKLNSALARVEKDSQKQVQTNEKKKKFTEVDVYFYFDSAELTESEIKKLDEFIKKEGLKKKVVKAEIYGYADTLGSQMYNRVLSKRRADAVAKFLKEKYGIEVLKVEGKGETKESDIFCLNRKAEIKFIEEE